MLLLAQLKEHKMNEGGKFPLSDSRCVRREAVDLTFCPEVAAAEKS